MLTLRMIHKGKLWFVLIICVQFATISYSQRPGKTETINYINKKLSPSCTIAVKGGDIIATYFDKEGQKLREDRVAFGFLDTIVRYDKTEQMFFVSTNKGCETCVTRKLFLQKTKRFYSRLTFVMDGSEAEIKGLKKALVHLIRIGSEFRYHDEITFEQ